MRRRTPTLVFASPPSVPTSLPTLSALPSRRLLPALLLSVPVPSAPFWARPAAAAEAPLRVERVRGDGRCLYRSLARGLAAADGRRLTERLEVADADALRQIAWEQLCSVRRKELEARHVVEGSIGSYCRAMRDPRFFAGEAEVLVISEYFGVEIDIYIRNAGKLNKIMRYGEGDVGPKGRRKDGKAKKRVGVLYNGVNHYDAVVRR